MDIKSWPVYVHIYAKQHIVTHSARALPAWVVAMMGVASPKSRNVPAFHSCIINVINDFISSENKCSQSFQKTIFSNFEL